jgi:hypothetical protein
MRQKIIIGAPTNNRHWIIRDWLNKLHGSFVKVKSDYDLGIILVASEHDDSVRTVSNFCDSMGYKFKLVPIEETREGDVRSWGYERYERMVYLRNLLLTEVRSYEPEYFLSLDTDILLHPDCVSNLLQTIKDIEPAVAVGGKTFMTPRGKETPSFGMFIRDQVSQGIRRSDSDGVMQVDVIMAIKLMSPIAYNVDYEFHTHGEDVGWSAACRDRKLKLWWDGRVASKHVMEFSMLNQLDGRCGF